MCFDKLDYTEDKPWNRDSDRSCKSPVIMFWIAFLLWSIGNAQTTQTIVFTNNTATLSTLTEVNKITAIVFQVLAMLIFFVNSLSLCTGFIYIPSTRRIDQFDGEICSCTDCCCPKCKTRPYLIPSLFCLILVSGTIMLQTGNWYILETPLTEQATT